jgi:lipopolysaccharide export LptBFGC system permease protein LptF
VAIATRESAPRKRSIASLVGGVVIAVGCFVLWLLVASQLTQRPPSLPLVASGLIVALAVGFWIRLADL